MQYTHAVSCWCKLSSSDPQRFKTERSAIWIICSFWSFLLLKNLTLTISSCQLPCFAYLSCKTAWFTPNFRVDEGDSTGDAHVKIDADWYRTYGEVLRKRRQVVKRTSTQTSLSLSPSFLSSLYNRRVHKTELLIQASKASDTFS